MEETEKINLLTEDKESALKETLASLRSKEMEEMITESDSYIIVVTCLKGKVHKGFVSRGGGMADQGFLSIQAIKRIITTLESLGDDLKELKGSSK